MLKLAVLGSGKGSNFEAILQAVREGRLAARIVMVAADEPGAGILQKARAAGIPAHFVNCSPYRTKLDGPAEEQVLRLLREAGADTLALAGFMRMVKTGLLRALPNRIINIHPSLLPAFPGLDSCRQMLAYGVKAAGCTVHFVDSGMDTGPIIIQRTVPVFAEDTESSLHARIQEQEHRAFPEALQLLAAGRLDVRGRIVHVAAPREDAKKR